MVGEGSGSTEGPQVEGQNQDALILQIINSVLIESGHIAYSIRESFDQDDGMLIEYRRHRLGVSNNNVTQKDYGRGYLLISNDKHPMILDSIFNNAMKFRWPSEKEIKERAANGESPIKIPIDWSVSDIKIHYDP